MFLASSRSVIHREIVSITDRDRKYPVLKGKVYGFLQPGTGKEMDLLRTVKEKEAVDILTFFRGAENCLQSAIEIGRTGIAEMK